MAEEYSIVIEWGNKGLGIGYLKWNAHEEAILKPIFYKLRNKYKNEDSRIGHTWHESSGWEQILDVIRLRWAGNRAWGKWQVWVWSPKLSVYEA